MNVLPENLVFGKKYTLIMVSNGAEYKQATAVFRGRKGKNLIWENVTANGNIEKKSLNANSLIYRNVVGGSKKNRRSKNRKTMRR